VQSGVAAAVAEAHRREWGFVLAVEVDGRVESHAGPGGTLSLSLVREAAHLVRLGGTSFYQRTRRKLRVMGSLEADAGL
jgi:NAD+ kinase